MQSGALSEEDQGVVSPDRYAVERMLTSDDYAVFGGASVGIGGYDHG